MPLLMRCGSVYYSGHTCVAVAELEPPVACSVMDASAGDASVVALRALRSYPGLLGN